jgi:hypothetical protein
MNRGAENREAAKGAKTDAKECRKAEPQMHADGKRFS